MGPIIITFGIMAVGIWLFTEFKKVGDTGPPSLQNGKPFDDDNGASIQIDDLNASFGIGKHEQDYINSNPTIGYIPAPINNDPEPIQTEDPPVPDNKEEDDGSLSFIASCKAKMNGFIETNSNTGRITCTQTLPYNGSFFKTYWPS